MSTHRPAFAASRLPLVLILIAFIVAGAIYAWATPPLEASDELWHMGMVDVIADTGALPVQNPNVETAWEQEGSQPPLYYFVAAALVRPIDRGDFDMLRQPNPHAKAGVPGATDNKNLVLHDTPHTAPVGTALAVYVLRAFGIALGAVTVAAVYATAHRLGGSTVALLAAGLTAFNPMFLFISASVNNDNLVTALNSLGLWQMVVLVQDGFSPRRSMFLALLLAGVALSKLSGLVLLPVVGLAALWVVYRQREWRGLILLGAFTLLTVGILAGWWYARNLTLYGELFGTQTMVAVAGPRAEPFTLQTLIDEFEGFRVGYWGWFGAVNVVTTPLYYRVMDAVTLIALVGLAVHLWRVRRNAGTLVPPLLLILTLVIGSISLIVWTAQTYASQGRLLFPFVAATSPLLALGLETFLRPLARQLPLRELAVGAFALVALFMPLTVIAPVYTMPQPVAALPSSAMPVYARFGDVALVGYETADQRYEPGDSVPITVYWQVLENTERDLSLYLHAVNDAGEVLGRIDSFPGGGRLRTTTWMPDAIYADRYDIPLEPDASGRSRLRVQVGWWHYETGDVVPPVDADGQPLESVMLNVGGFAGPHAVSLPDDRIDISPVSFGGVIDLIAYRLDGDQLALVWRATGTPDDRYTVFVQALDETNGVVAQGDAPPDLPTRYWRAGETYVTNHTLAYPQPPAPGTYPLVVGWYRPDDFARLSVNAPGNAYPITNLIVP